MRKDGKGKRRHPPESERAGYTCSVAELVPRVGRRVFRRFGFVESAVVARWNEIVGSSLAEISGPDAIRFPQGKRSGGTLHLSVESVHALAVQHSEPEILERVNRYFGYGAVARITIRQVAGRKQGAAPARTAAAPRTEEPLRREADPELKQIGDDMLRGSLEALAAQMQTTRGPPKIS